MSEHCPEQVRRVTELVVQITQLLSESSNEDVVAALTAICAQRCLAHQNPDRAFLEIIDSAFAVFREASNLKYRNEDPAVS